MVEGTDQLAPTILACMAADSWMTEQEGVSHTLEFDHDEDGREIRIVINGALAGRVWREDDGSDYVERCT